MKNHKISLSTSESKNPAQVFLDRICDPDVLNKTFTDRRTKV